MKSETIYYSKWVSVLVTIGYGVITGVIVYGLLVSGTGGTIVLLGVFLLALIAVDIYLLGCLVIPAFKKVPAIIIDGHGVYIDIYSQKIDWNEIDSILMWNEKYRYSSSITLPKIGIRLHNLDNFISKHPDLKYKWAIRLSFRFRRKCHYQIPPTILKINAEILYEKLTRYHKEFGQTNSNSVPTGESLSPSIARKQTRATHN